MHGGDVYRNEVELDYSVNINPMGIPEKINEVLKESIKDIYHYPDIECAKAKEAIADYYSIDPAKVLLGNGASELIMAVCHAIRPQKALLLAPSFLGYEKALEAVDCEISYFHLLEEEDFVVSDRLVEEICKTKPDILFLTNPNNPTGHVLESKMVNRIAEACEVEGTYLVLDECFLELTENYKETLIYGMERYSKLFILRAFTKSFAIPGVRLGYGICDDRNLCEKIAKQLPEWNVSIFAQNVAVAAIKESAFLDGSRLFIKQERNFLKKHLEELGLKVYPSGANYLLFYESGEIDWYEKLLAKKILIRDCSNYEGLTKGFYRIAVRTPQDNRKLMEAMEEIVEDERED